MKPCCYHFVALHFRTLDAIVRSFNVIFRRPCEKSARPMVGSRSESSAMRTITLFEGGGAATAATMMSQLGCIEFLGCSRATPSVELVRLLVCLLLLMLCWTYLVLFDMDLLIILSLAVEPVQCHAKTETMTTTIVVTHTAISSLFHP